MALPFRRRIFVILAAMTAVPATLAVAGWVLSVSALAPTAGARASLEQIGASARDMLQTVDTSRLSPRALAILRQHAWPGNVRELENVLEHAMVCTHGRVIEPQALPESLLAAVRAAADGGAPAEPTPPPSADARDADASERGPASRHRGRPAAPRAPARPPHAALGRADLLRALEACAWRRAEAAGRLGIERTTLWRQMRRHGIAPPA